MRHFGYCSYLWAVSEEGINLDWQFINQDFDQYFFKLFISYPIMAIWGLILTMKQNLSEIALSENRHTIKNLRDIS
jgi:hypothetical protein